MVKSTKTKKSKGGRTTAKKTSGRKARTQKRDRKGRFKASTSSRIFSVFRPKKQNRPSAATRQKQNKAPKKNIDVEAKVNKGKMTSQTVENEYHKAVNDGFDMREIQVINNSGGVDITVDRVPKGEAAYYSGKNKNGRHDLTVNPKNIDAETLTHETVHILQETDPKRPPLDKKLKAFEGATLTPEERSLKEGLTEAETIARVRKPDKNSASMYPDIDPKDPWTLKEQDTKNIKSAMKGKPKGESPGVVAAIFDTLHLSKFKYRKSTKTAKAQRDAMEKEK